MNMLASTSSNSSSTAMGGGSSTVLQLLSKIRTNNRSVSSSSSFSLRISATCDDRPHAPSCIYVGPLQSATQETLEALYSQVLNSERSCDRVKDFTILAVMVFMLSVTVIAVGIITDYGQSSYLELAFGVELGLQKLAQEAREAYYKGEPLIVDDMFDRIELKLKWYGSKSVVKYPRCSIRRQSTYADAEEDLSMVFVLASTWSLFFAFGCSACIGPMFYTISLAYQNALNLGLSYGSQASELRPLFMLNTIIFVAIGFVIGYPVASASVKVLQGLWRNDLAALKGSCPNCGEEVFAFVRTDKANSPHRAKCHVCECLLEFRTEVEQSTSRFGRQWVHGRIYLVRSSRRQREM